MMLMPREWGYRKRFRTEYDAPAPEEMRMLDEQGMQWVRGTIRAVMVKRRITYGQLVDRLRAIGVDENERNLRNKVARGSFSAVFFIQCLEALGLKSLHLDMVESATQPGGEFEYGKDVPDKPSLREEREIEEIMGSIENILSKQDAESGG